MESKVTKAYQAADKSLESKVTKAYQAADKSLETKITKAYQSAISGKANKATTLKGYGITDAYTKSEIDKKLKNEKIKFSTITSRNQTIDNVLNIIPIRGSFRFTPKEKTAVIDISRKEPILSKSLLLSSFANS